jgi:hypothetical protein
MCDGRSPTPDEAIRSTPWQPTKGKQTRFLDAKGTETDGANVLLTPGEVRFATCHLGGGAIGIVSGILFQSDGSWTPPADSRYP